MARVELDPLELVEVSTRSQHETDRTIDLVGRTELLTAAAVLRRSALFIGNDTGLMHIAAASGLPTLGLFGPSDEQHYGPWGVHTRIARGPRTYEQIRAVDPSFVQALCHMMDLSVETVSEAAEELLAATDLTATNRGPNAAHA